MLQLLAGVLPAQCHPSYPVAMSVSPADVVRSLYAAFLRGDGAAVLALLDDAVVWRCHAPANVPYAGAFEGRDGVARFLAAVGASLAFEAFEAREILAAGERVVVLGNDRARAVATGRGFDAGWVHTWRVRDGRVVEFTEWTDGAALSAAFAGAPRAHVRRLGPDDAAAARAVRLRGVREHPDAFLVDVPEEERSTVADWEARLRAKEGRDDDGVLGAFDGDRLVGMAGFVRHERTKVRHRAVIWGMYVVPEARGRGIGRALLDSAVAALRACGDIEIAELSVAARDGAARALYVSAGFVPWGTERDALRLADGAVDELHLALRLHPRAR